MSIQRQIDRLIVHRAAEWLEVLQAERVDEYPHFLQWINESPRHMDEFLQLLALSFEVRWALQGASIDRVALLSRISHKATDFHGADHERIDYLPRDPRNSTRQSLRYTGALAATAAVVAIAAVWLSGALSPWEHFEAPSGEQHTFALVDGSVVTLNARSEMRARISETARDIQLVSGDALFRVTNETQRPFRVHTADVTVQAVGTLFDVATRLDGTRVAVIEGRVRVAAKGHSVPPLNPALSISSVPQHEQFAVTPVAAGEVVHVSSMGLIK